MSIYRYVNNSGVDISSSGYYVPAWGFLQTTNLVLALDSYVNIKLDLFIDSVKQTTYTPATIYTIGTAGSINVLMHEGKSITPTYQSGTTGTINRIDQTGAVLETWAIPNKSSGSGIGPYSGTQEFNIVCSAGSITTSTSSSILAVTPTKIAVQIAESSANLIPSNRFLLRPDSAANPIFDVTPTHFFDPTASTSTGSGTYANPFITLAQIETYFNGTLSGLAFNKVLGLKRGTSIRGKLNLTVTGFSNSAGGKSTDSPFMIVPYGNAAAMPKIIGAVLVNTWTFDGQFWWYDTGANREVDVFQDGIRIYKKNNRANALAAGPGFGYWIANKVFILPYSNNGNINATSTIIEVTSPFGDLANNNGHTLIIQYKNQARTGNIIVAGIEVDKSINSLISIQSPTTSTAITFIDTLQIIGCKLTNSGVDQFAVGAASDGAVIAGRNDTVRASNVYVGGNDISGCINNAVETNGVSNGIIEWNSSRDCGGNTIAELFASCSNIDIRYNKGVGTGAAYQARSATYYQGCGIWVPGYIWTIGSESSNTDVTRNAGINISFNSATNNRNQALNLEAINSCNVTNNTFHSVGKNVDNTTSNGASTVAIGTSTIVTGASTAIWNNNIVINDGQDNITMQLGRTSGTTRNANITGDSNMYYNTASGYAQNATISTLSNTGATVAASNLSYTNIESWTAGVNAIGGVPIDAKGRMHNPRIDVPTGRPQLGSQAATRSVTMPVGFYTDLSGKPIMTSFTGAYQL